MFVLRVMCNCGFETEPAVWGPGSLFSQERVGMPVLIPSAGKLVTHWFDSNELNVRPEELDAWIRTHGSRLIASAHGSDAMVIGPPGASSDKPTCPKCGHEARVEVVGIH